jgi:hypothetical protein
MATVQLADIIDVTVFQDLPAVNSPEKTAFFQSGVVTRNTLLDSIATAAGKFAELPFWKDIDATVAPNLSNDNPASLATPDKIVQGEQSARKAFLNKGLSATDLASEIAMGPRAMEHIRNRVDTYWMRQWQRRLIASCNGVLADNVASNGGDMVVNVAVESTASQTATTRFNRDTFTDAVYTMGDAADGLRAIAVHSAVMKQMVKNDDIVYIPDSQGQLIIPTYMGLRVIVDDGLPVVAGTTSGFKYTSVIFGEGAFGWGDGAPINPVEVDREAAQGNGAGIETLWTRKTWLLHPFGYKNTGTPAAVSFSLAELAAATTWERVIERKNVPISFIVTN